ncbi:MAG: hypothetical protein FJZ87_15350 [Chloroflexi bacterium]|nr:hypothetical protein [Chloroflexota bacterium]
MATIDLKKLVRHRLRTFHLAPARRLRNFSQAAKFVNARGFIHFWPIRGVELPSLWTAVAGNRPVADEHDDPGHITWKWKDHALGKRVWHYAKILRRKGTMISLEVLPFFYALSENYGSPEEDYLQAYREGRLSREARQIFETLLERGPLNTIDLRRCSNLSNAGDSVFNKALEQLQADFKILPIAVADAGAWHYAHVYEVVSRHYPELPEAARAISESNAREGLAERYLAIMGAIHTKDVSRLFNWGMSETMRTISSLVAKGRVFHARHPKSLGEWIAIRNVAFV